MSWAVGYDDKWQRWIGYGVPAYCDHPGCGKEIDRGLAYVCTGEQPYGGERGCGLYFCGTHRGYKCRHKGFTATPEHPDWTNHMLTHESWKEWRDENPEKAAALSQPSEPSKSQVKRIALERGESPGLADSGEVGNG